MRDFLSTGNNTDLVEGTDFGAQATMDAKDFAIDDSTEDEEIEDLTACFPHRGIAVLLLALFIETVDLCDLTGLVIAADECDTIRVSGSEVSLNFNRTRQICT